MLCHACLLIWIENIGLILPQWYSSALTMNYHVNGISYLPPMHETREIEIVLKGKLLNGLQLIWKPIKCLLGINQIYTFNRTTWMDSLCFSFFVVAESDESGWILRINILILIQPFIFPQNVNIPFRALAFCQCKPIRRRCHFQFVSLIKSLCIGKKKCHLNGNDECIKRL